MKIEKKEYDLVVVGAGLSGMCAAISAARNGLKVALLGNRPVLGGNASVEIGIDINGACDNSQWSVSVYARETGIIEEIKQDIFHRAGYEQPKSASYNGVLFDAIFREKNIDLYLNTQAVAVQREGDKILAVEGVQLTTEKKFIFYAPLFADCTGDGFVGAEAGAEFMLGSEGYDEYHESLAPPTHTDIVSGTTLMFSTVHTGKAERYIPPDFAYDVTKLPHFEEWSKNGRSIYQNKHIGGYHGFWWVEYGNPLSNISDSEEITGELRKVVYGLWDYIKNSGNFENVEDVKLLSVGNVGGKRESRRFVGDTIVTQNDIASKREYEDNCYAGGWSMDVHADYGIYDADRPTHWNFVPGMYNMPYSTLYSKNISNMFMAGRNTSCTRIANGSTRVMATCAVAGQAVGVAAALCKKHGCMPRGVKEKHIEELRKTLLRQDQTLMGYKEEIQLEGLKVTASSVATVENASKESVKPLMKSHVLAIPLSTDRVDSVEIGLKNVGDKEVKVGYSVLKGDEKENYLPRRREKRGEVSLPAGFDGFATFPLDTAKGKDGKVYILLDVCEQVELYVTKNILTGVPTFTAWEKEVDERDCRNFVLTRVRENICFRNVQPTQYLYAPENVFSGYNRPYGTPNLWVSAGKKEEYLRAEFTPRQVEELQLVFNTDLAEDIITFQAPCTVEKYTLTVIGEGYEKKFEVEGNYRRINAFKIGAKIHTVLFEPKENYGAKGFELFGIKTY